MNRLIEQLSLLSEAPGGIQRLREIILQLAVQGKLVPQDPSDEPASVLLEKIADEKARLIKEKRIKKQKEYLPISVHEQPFSPPQGWQWANLGDICQLKNGDRSKNYPSRKDHKQEGIPFINAGHLNNGEIDFSNMNYISENRYKTISSGKIERNDILFCLRGSLGKSAIITGNHGGAIASSLVIIRLIGSTQHKYMHYYLNSALATKMIAKFDNGTAQPNLAAGNLAKFKLPIPPLAEQKRIVERVDALMALCGQLEATQEQTAEKRAKAQKASLEALGKASSPDEFDTSWKRVLDHWETLLKTPEDIASLRQTILQLAVQGKLVPQDPRDEPASTQINKIAKEKAQLIKEKKIKKQKPLPLIQDDEKPFDIPKGWSWALLSNLVFDFQNGISKRSGKDGKETPVLRLADIKNGEISEECLRLIKLSRKEQEKYFVSKDDILVIRVNGSLDLVGKFVLCRHEKEWCYCDHLIRVRPSNNIQPQFIRLYSNTAFARTHILQNTKTTAGQKTINQTGLSLLPIPIPPLAEQKRIIAKADSLMAICDQLEAALVKSQDVAADFAKAMVGVIQ